MGDPMPDDPGPSGPHRCPPRPSTPTEAGFERRPMVRWLDPHQLLDTAARVVLSGTFSSYADAREQQAFVAAEAADRTGTPELWLDYVADLGDGWNSTYTVARLLATEALKLDWDDQAVATERGSILVMGGDQVYPVPNRTEYENRLLGPYRSALPCAGGHGPELFAIPGSHDWYDGLINFTSVFCRGRSIGGWRTSQTRSYFALALPHGWWLWGIDLQFGAHFDEAQLRYFSGIATEALQEGDRVILCMAKEVDSGRANTEVYSDRDLGYLEREVIEPSGARVAVYLKSGRHHYCRYEEEGGDRQLITAGGGGAFLHPTHRLPERVDPPGEGETGTYRRAATYPSARGSKGLRKRIWLLPFYNVPLAGVFAGVYVLLVFMLELHLDERHVGLGFDDVRQALWQSPTAFLLILLMIVTFGGMVRFAHDADGFSRVALGLVHSSLQFTTVAVVMLSASRLVEASGLSGAPSLVVFLGLVGLLGGTASIVGVAGYLWATNCLGFHGNEAYAPLHHMDQKNFLRLHIDARGTLTVYPVGIDRVGRHWRLSPEATAHAPWFAPTGSDAPPHLIEEPVRITKAPAGRAAPSGPS